MTDKWQGGKTYVPGSLVIPTASTVVEQLQPANAGFESGDLTGWTTTDASHWTVTNVNPYEGTYSVRITGSALTSMQSTTKPDIKVGQSVSVSVKAEITNSGTDDAHFQVVLQWLDDAGNILPGASGFVVGNEIQGKGGSWAISTASGAAPAGAAKFNISLSANPGTHGSVINVDAAAYAYAFAPPNPNIIYKATQEAPAKSASTEPDWPGVVGVEVTDGGVTWEGVLATRVVWEASPILQSGDTEPTWPTDPGAVVHDGNIDWITITSQISDVNCPNSKVVAIMASKVFAVDKDIVRFSATVNPLDWTSTQDAGYLPTGLQQANSNDMAVLAPYRSNLTAFNASSFQNWQVDPDPAAMALLDQMDGVGSTHTHAAQPVGNDLYYLSQLGVRSVGIANATTNLQAGDVGMPIDVLVQASVKLDETPLGPIATYYPSAGQYWLAINQGDSDPAVYVHTLNAGKGKWSRYLFPFAVDAFAQLGNDLYIRHGDEVSVVSEDAVTDDVDGVATNFTGVVWWPWLDNGQPGETKMLESFDYVGTGQGPSVSIGYDQRSLTAFTPPYLIDDDTLPGDPIPLPVGGPTLSVKLEFAGGAAWTVNQVTLNLSGMK